jgi:hypothetical protein
MCPYVDYGGGGLKKIFLSFLHEKRLWRNGRKKLYLRRKKQYKEVCGSYGTSCVLFLF